MENEIGLSASSLLVIVGSLGGETPFGEGREIDVIDGVEKPGLFARVLGEFGYLLQARDNGSVIQFDGSLEGGLADFF